ncbi:PREDICTED: zinc finger BED domain-containing protein 1-like [Rhagoletis zephyria]|uniref:zinc finger BED domain-containing protein 1-like n=1 Tax=Rhagoletis zephyria TaxID=28612 RepID=UPI00081159DD|nr:PREDICTED: zinc finger BED domain-containing protein 1-like [Rhagoletis zephyria]
MNERHTAINLRNVLIDSVTDWNISQKICAVASDNAANVIAAIRLTGWQSIPCLAHTLHLIICDSFKESNVDVLRDKCRSIVEYFHRSIVAANKLKEVQTTMNKPQLKLKMEVQTRWNSTFHMIQRLIEVQEPLEATIGVLHNPISILAANEWEVLNEISQLLKPFEDLTMEMSAEQYVTVSKIQAVYLLKN